MGSGQVERTSGYLNSSSALRYSNGSTPPNGHSPVGSMGDLQEEETPVPNDYQASQNDYFDQAGGSGGSDDSPTTAEQSFGGVPHRTRPEAERRTSEELRRRGSVDDRTMTMSTGRLFVANPDLSD